MYSLLTNEELLRISPLPDRIVKDETKRWYVKYSGQSGENKRDLLAYSLGKDICNVAEVKLLAPEEHLGIKSLLGLEESSDPHNTFLVRLASDYSLEELPCKTAEKAVATELVYSVWIRRRDAHSDNREYAHGIPIFYDHHIAFLAEPQFAHSTMFFKDPRDYGHPYFWRVKQIVGKMHTLKARNVSGNERAYHYINDVEQFKKELRLAEETVTKLASSNIEPVIAASGFNSSEVEWIKNFLANNLVTLPNDIIQMEEIIFKDWGYQNCQP